MYVHHLSIFIHYISCILHGVSSKLLNWYCATSIRGGLERSFVESSWPLWYSYDCLSAKEAILRDTMKNIGKHYDDVIMDGIASLITSLTIVYTTVYSDTDQSKHQSSASLAFVWGIHRGPMNSPHKWPVTRKMFPFDDVIMKSTITKQNKTP